MELKNRILDWRNRIDFALRSSFHWSRPVGSASPIPGIDFRVQKEFKEFITLFHWKEILADMPERLSIADVGARNFCFAPIFDSLFSSLGYDVELHGIEIDAYRRLVNLHTRYDYGVYYAKQCKNAEFHPIDFLHFKSEMDICFLLNPFVSDEPTLHWGLPLSKLMPERIFEHTLRLVKPKKGIAVLGSPSPEEYEIACGIAKKVGFVLGEEVLWTPKPGSQQQKPRYGVVLTV